MTITTLTASQLTSLTLPSDMSAYKLWRPFEDKPEPPEMARVTVTTSPTRRQSVANTTVTYSFDLNRSRSPPIGYLATSPADQLITSHTSINHLSGNQMTMPMYQTPAQENWSKVRQRYMGVQPRYDDSRVTERPKFMCDFEGCTKSFIYKSALESHRLVHSPERRFRCSLCDKRYKQLSGLYSHQSVKHTDRSQRFVCNDCHYSFNDYRNLKYHEFSQHSKAVNPLVANLKAFEREM